MKDYTFTWIRFVERARPQRRGVTKRWDVLSKRGGLVLGTVHWDTAWRCYVFAPLVGVRTIYEQDCLRDLATFVEDRTREHKAARAAEKATA